MNRTILFLLPLSLLVACGDKGDDTGAAGGGAYDSILALTGDEASGATVYASTCSGCHAADGTGGTGPSLVEHAQHFDDEALLDIVFNGRGSMPGFSLEDQDAADLLAYIRAEFG